MSDWSCRQREARSHLRLFHLVLGSHDGRALVPIPKRSAYPASDLDVVVVDSLKALDPNRPIREGFANSSEERKLPAQADWIRSWTPVAMAIQRARRNGFAGNLC